MDHNKQNDRRVKIRLAIGCLLLALGIIILAMGISIAIPPLLTVLGIDSCLADKAAGLAEGIIAAIAAGFVLYQLKDGENSRKRQAEVETAQFILEYNRSFIENKDMAEIEHYMESSVTKESPHNFRTLSNDRQSLVNYLVYLEGFSSSIHGNILRVEDIDDLFAYRFFLAMNHPEVQNMELIPYGTYYKGCYQLYDKWMTYRMLSDKFSNPEKQDEPNDPEVPLLDNALWNHYGYEKHATPNLVIETDAEKCSVTCRFDGSNCSKLSWDENGTVTVIFFDSKLLNKDKKSKLMKHKVLRIMLKELLYNANILKSGMTFQDANGNLTSTDSDAKTIFDQLIKARDHLQKPSLCFRQLINGNKLSTENLERIARLIYKTDRFIYPDMFGSEARAVKVLPDLISNGQDSMFRLNNMYVCEWNEIVIGLLLWHKGSLNWTAANLKSAMSKKNIQPPATLETVEREYVSGYSAENQSIHILNLCVADEVRGNGIGTKLMTAFLDEHIGTSTELCVLSDNVPAQKLYESCGFRQLGGTEQAYPSTKQNHTRITMRNNNGS